jgi:hypothetical protein
VVAFARGFFVGLGYAWNQKEHKHGKHKVTRHVILLQVSLRPTFGSLK